jgi:hypothetical protein
MVTKVRLYVTVSEEVWRRLRDAAERDRASTGRASVNEVVGRIIERELSASIPLRGKA